MPATPIIRGETWVYHKEHGAKLIYWHELDEYQDNGWVDTPDKFKNEPEESITLSDLTRKELLSIAQDKGVSLKRNPRKQDIIEAINGFSD